MSKRGWWIFKSKAERVKLNAAEKQIVDHLVRDKELDLHLQQKELEYKRAKQKHELELQRLTDEHNLAIMRAEDDLERTKREFREQMTREKERLEFEHELREKEFLVQKRLEIDKIQRDCENKIKEAEIEAKRKITEETAKIRDQVYAERDVNLKKNYDKLSESMVKLHEEGNKTTKFLETMTLKMLDRAPDVAKLSFDMNPNNMNRCGRSMKDVDNEG